MRFCFGWMAALTWLLPAGAGADSTVVFNEIMYHPRATNEAQLEWVELHNQMAVDMDLSGWSLAGGVRFTFTEGTVLGGGASLVVASSPATLMATTAATNVLGPFVGRLSNDGDRLELRNNNQRLMDAVNYGVDGLWPVGADGAGVSLSKRNPNAGSVSPENWTISSRLGGTPGKPNFAGLRPAMEAPIAVALAFNEIESATNANFFVELINYGKTNMVLAGCSIARLGGIHREFTFDSGLMGPGSHLLVPRSTLGFSADPGDKLVLYGPGQSNVLDAVVARGAPRARLPDGTGPWLHPAQPTPGAANVVSLHHEIVINEIMYQQRPLPATPAVYGQTNSLVNITNEWRFDQQGIDPGPAWRQPEYNDDAWRSGRSLFHVSTAFLGAPKNTALSLTNESGARLIAWYFRTPFNFTGEVAGVELLLRHIVDDGVVYYLNGVEVLRQNMPAGPIRYTNLASISVATPILAGPFAIPNNALRPGTNWLAVEVHQFTTNALGADVVFGAELMAMSRLASAQPRRESPESWVELFNRGTTVGSSRVDLQACKLEYSIVSPK